MDFVKHTRWLVPLILFGMVGAVSILRPTDRVPSSTHAPSKSQQAKADQPKPDVASPSADAQEQQGKTEVYRADCNKPEKHQDADFCQQVRMADAADRQVRIGLFGLGLVGATLIATGAAAVAAWWTVRTMQSTAERQLRAYVFVDSIALQDASRAPPIPNNPSDPAAGRDGAEHPVRPKGTPGVTWTIKNSGQTPAYDVVHWGVFEVLPVSEEDTVVVPDILNSPTIKSYIAPGSMSTKQGWYDRALTEGEMADIRNGIRAVYVFGRVEYKDAFKRKRFTAYRLRYTKSAYPPIGPTTFHYCEGGNDAD